MWKKLGQECATNGVSFDSYFFPSSYMDLATVGCISALSGGDQFLYTAFDANKHGAKFANDLQMTLSRNFGYDALLRVRASAGLKVADYFGNFYMKNDTDVDLAGVDSLKAVGVGLQYDGKLDERADVYIQMALLYTTADGHRRVRVHNLVLGVASQLNNVFRNAEMDCTVNFLARSMVQQTYSMPLKAIRDLATTTCVKILGAYRANCATSSSDGQLILPEAFKLMPLYTLSMLKSRAFRSGKIVPSDLRVYTMRLFQQLGVAETTAYLYPSVYDLTHVDPEVGKINQNGMMKFPPILRASIDRLSANGVYLAGIAL